MREIEFRGKRLDNNKWVYGCYWRDSTWNGERKESHYIKQQHKLNWGLYE